MKGVGFKTLSFALLALPLCSVSAAQASFASKLGGFAKGVAKVGLHVAGSKLTPVFGCDMEFPLYPTRELLQSSTGRYPGRPQYDDIKLSFWYGEGNTDTQGFTALLDSFLNLKDDRSFDMVAPLGKDGEVPDLAIGLLDCRITQVTLPGMDHDSDEQCALGNVMQANGSLVRAESEFNLLKMEDMKRVRVNSTLSSAKMSVPGVICDDVDFVSPITINAADVNGDGLVDLDVRPFTVRVARGTASEKAWAEWFARFMKDPLKNKLDAAIHYATKKGQPVADAGLHGMGFLACSDEKERGITINTSHVEYRCFTEKASFSGRPGIGHPN